MLPKVKSGGIEGFIAQDPQVLSDPGAPLDTATMNRQCWGKAGICSNIKLLKLTW